MESKDWLKIAKEIAVESYGDGIEVEMLKETPTKVNSNMIDREFPVKTKMLNRWEFKCSLKSNTAEIEKEFYLYLYEPIKEGKLKESDGADNKVVYEFVYGKQAGSNGDN